MFFEVTPDPTSSAQGETVDKIMRLQRRAGVEDIAANGASVCKMVALSFVPLWNVEAEVDGVSSNGARREDLGRHRERAIHADEQGMSVAAKAVDPAQSPGARIQSIHVVPPLGHVIVVMVSREPAVHQRQLSGVVHQVHGI